MELNLSDPAFLTNPYPYYAQIRAIGRPLWLPPEPEVSSNGVWMFWRYSDAREALLQTSGVSKNVASVRPEDRGSLYDLFMMNRDEPDHTRLRRLTRDFFSGSYLERLEPHITSIADLLLQEMKEKSEIDLIADFAEHLPLMVIARIIGVPVQDLPQIRLWTLDLIKGLDALQSNDESIQFAKRSAMKAFTAYVKELTEREPENDSLIQTLLEAERRGEIDRDETIGNVLSLLFTGHETTINLIGNSLFLLLEHREQWNELLGNPALIPMAIEEVLRFESPIQRTSFRILTEPIVLGGIKIKPGDEFKVIIGAANRDESIFHNPDVFDIRRHPNPHFGFGTGSYVCLGQKLARLEAKVALGRILATLPELHLTETPPQWRKNSAFRGLQKLAAKGSISSTNISTGASGMHC